MTRTAQRRARAVSPAARALRGLVVGGLFVVISLVNLCWPEPRGPADQGDFARIVARFSTGPVGLPWWPDASDPSRRLRFSEFYNESWRFDGGNPDWVRPSSSELVFLPERAFCFARDGATYDLRMNTACVLGLIGLALAVTAAALSSLVPVVTLAALSMVLGDLQVSWYLNSFYQEAGAFVFTSLLLCVLFAWWERRAWQLLGASFVLLALLATTKAAYAPSIVLLAAGVAVTALVGARDQLSRAVTVIGFVGVVASALTFALATKAEYQQEVAYNFVVTAALPALPKDARTGYLVEIGLPEEFAQRVGVSIYDANRPMDLALSARLDNRLHARAVWILATRYPLAFVQVLGSGFVRAGNYYLPEEGYGFRVHGAPMLEAARVDFWSSGRAGLLAGWRGYALAVLLIVVAVRRAAYPRWARFFVLLAAGFLAASVAGVAIAVLGNGGVDLMKHLYLANLSCDVAIVLGFGGLLERLPW